MIILRTLTTPNADGNVQQNNTYSLMVGTNNGTSSLKDSLEASYKTK